MTSLIGLLYARPFSFDDLRAFVEANPESVEQRRDDDGWTSLHIAAYRATRSEIPLAALQYLVEKWSEGLKVKNKLGDLPLHLACVGEEEGSLEVIQCVVEQYPEGLQVKDRRGHLPLHFACTYRSPLRSIQCLVEQYPEGVRAVSYTHLTLPTICSV